MLLSLSKRIRFTGLALALLLPTVTLAQSAHSAQSSTRPTPPPPSAAFANLEDRPWGAPTQQAGRLLFLRPATPTDSWLPADLMVNGRFHASLLPGGFSEVDVCPGPTTIELGGEGTSGLQRRPLHTTDARAGQATYIIVQGPDTATPLRTETDRTLAQARLKDLRRQIHTLSRLPLARNCPVAPAQAAPLLAAGPAPKPLSTEPLPAPLPPASRPAQPAKFTLAAEALFDYGGSKPQHLAEQGQTQILRVARQIKEQIRPTQTVVVQGHTDPSGPSALNKRISQERADTVRMILINSGLPARQVRAEGLGSLKLLVKDCERVAKTRDARINCNRPNRRVEITLTPAPN